MKIKVTDDGYTQNQGNWHLKGALRKEWIVSGKGRKKSCQSKRRKKFLDGVDPGLVEFKACAIWGGPP